MKCESLCIPCFFKQAHSSVTAHTDEESLREQVLFDIAGFVPDLDMERSPAYNSSLVMHQVDRLIGRIDPFKEHKKKHNELALSMLEDLTKLVSESEDPLQTAIRLSVVGNVIDMGIKHEADIEGTMQKALGKGFARFEIDAFRQSLDQTSRILYIVDNAGEIVFDIVLIELLARMGKEVIVAVKSGPIINDATMDDADQVGLHKYCKVIKTGSDFVGITRELLSPAMIEAFDTADLIVSKGQGNYETLEGTSERIFFILKAKCQLVADNLGVRDGDLVFVRFK